MKEQNLEGLTRRFCKKPWCRLDDISSNLQDLPSPPSLTPEVFGEMYPVRVCYSVQTDPRFRSVDVIRYVLRKGEDLPPDITGASSQLHNNDKPKPIQTGCEFIISSYLGRHPLDFDLENKALLMAIKDAQHILILLDVIQKQKTNNGADNIYEVYSNDNRFLRLYLVALRSFLSELSYNKVRLNLKFKSMKHDNINMFKEEWENFIEDYLQKFSDLVLRIDFRLRLSNFLKKFGINFDLAEVIEAIESDRTSLDPRFNLNAPGGGKCGYFAPPVKSAQLPDFLLETELLALDQGKNRVVSEALLKIKED